MGVVVDPLHHFGQTFTNGLKNGVLGDQHGFLRDVGDANALLYVERTVIWAIHPGQNFEQRRFARAVATDQADALRCLQREVCVIEECDMAKSQRSVQECE